jgi:hypothetical protein
LAFRCPPKRRHRIMPTETSPTALNAGQRFHLDRCAEKIAAEVAEGDPDELLDTSVFAELLGVSP